MVPPYPFMFASYTVSAIHNALVPHTCTQSPHKSHSQAVFSTSSARMNITPSGHSGTQAPHIMQSSCTTYQAPLSFCTMHSTGQTLAQSPHWVQVLTSYTPGAGKWGSIISAAILGLL